MALLCAVFGAVLFYGQAVAVRHRAAGGADLAALAAADHWAEGGTAACARAGRLAAVQGVRLVRCAIVGDTSDVTAAVGRGPFAAEVRSRAGPPGPVPPGIPDGFRAVPPPEPGLPGRVSPGTPDGLRSGPPADPGPPGRVAPGIPAVPSAESGAPWPVPPGVPDGLQAVPPAEPRARPDPPSP
ncbi:flp pilus-assembly TadE/G-like family protein [Streptomyces sp. MBT70]|nr:flp pilus-assembly TadE/G-like family protein [Streptomyces sp. MBT70]